MGRRQAVTVRSGAGVFGAASWLSQGGDRPALQVTFGKVGECVDPFRSIVKCRNVVIFPTTGCKEVGFSFKGDFLERFQAVGRESGAQDVYAGELLFPKLDQRGRGVGLQPLGTSEARLEGDARLIDR